MALSPVVGGGLVHSTNLACCAGKRGGENRQTHYWALRQQARCSLATVCGGRRVVALLWWWGVVFDLWIVVASIKDGGLRERCHSFLWVGVCFLCGWLSLCNANFSDTRMRCVPHTCVGCVVCVS